MSMTISDYLSGSYQNTWAAGTEKQDQKNSALDVGKTKENAASASLDSVNTGEDGIAVTQVGRQQESAGAQQYAAYPSTDTVEISAEGLAASAKLQSQAADSTAASEYEYEEDDLSQYTDAELKQMYYRGEITLQEYEDETGETLE